MSQTPTPPKTETLAPAAEPAMKPYKYTPENLRNIQLVLETGGTRTAAAAYGGITKDTFYQWMEKLPEFVELVILSETKARVFVESKLYELVKAGDGPSIRFWLETQGKQDWLRTRVSVSQGVTVNPNKEGAGAGRQVTVISRVSGLSEQDLDDIMRGIPGEEQEQ